MRPPAPNTPARSAPAPSGASNPGGRGTFHARIVRASVRFTPQAFARPLVLSTGEIRVITQADAVVSVRIGEREVDGRGCVYLSDLWAWPDPAIDHATRDAGMRACCDAIAGALPARLGTAAHPLELGLQLHHWVLHDWSTPGGAEPAPPALARVVCASIFDAAIHDAVGVATGRNAMALYDDDAPVPSADALFGGPGQACAAVRELLLPEPRTTSPAWWIVGKSDDLEADVRPAVDAHGYTAFKLKLMGQDADVDARRTADVFAAARSWGIAAPRLGIDSNESNPDAGSVTGYLDKLHAIDPDAYAALEMIEQPTPRDISAAPFDWRAVADRKPVLVDEGLLSFEAMEVARQQGWSGFALKTCKGHSFVLTAAAWARRHGMTLSLQDLTNPNLAAVHAGLLAACLPTINGVELNSPQFTPDANAQLISHFPGLFEVHGGVHVLPDPTLPGLGTTASRPL